MGKRGFARTSENVLDADARRPILFLRSFKDDERYILEPVFWWWTRINRRVQKDVSLEEAIALNMDGEGPIVAVGKPDEWAPALGARRMYLGNDWKEQIHDLILRSQRIVIFLGSSSGVQWEYDEILPLKCLFKTLMVIPPVSIDDVQRRWNTFIASVGTREDVVIPTLLPASAVFITFKTDNSATRGVVHESPGVRNPRMLRGVCAEHYENALRQIVTSDSVEVA
jgi:hypothetical protein